MEKLKAILADKILDLKTTDENDVKLNVEKIQRFMDFANACQALIGKYPKIGDELIKMAESNDFDTKVASTRVDSIIRFAEENANSINIENEIQITPAETENVIEVGEAQQSIELEESQSAHEESGKDVEIISIEDSQTLDEESEKRKVLFKRIVQVILLVIGVIILIFVVRFIIDNWVTVLYILGGIAILGLIVLFLKKKKS